MPFHRLELPSPSELADVLAESPSSRPEPPSPDPPARGNVGSGVEPAGMSDRSCPGRAAFAGRHSGACLAGHASQQRAPPTARQHRALSLATGRSRSWLPFFCHVAIPAGRARQNRSEHPCAYLIEILNQLSDHIFVTLFTAHFQERYDSHFHSPTTRDPTLARAAPRRLPAAPRRAAVPASRSGDARCPADRTLPSSSLLASRGS